MIEDQKTDLTTDSSARLAKLARLFYVLGTDCRKNIEIILEQACHIFEGTIAFYSRFDPKAQTLTILAGHNLPQDFVKQCPAKGHICWEATIKGERKPVVYEDLKATPFYDTDPNIQNYHLRSYLGFPVRCENQAIGALCIVDTQPRSFSTDDIHCIQTLATALSLEEERLLLEQRFIQEKNRYQILVENASDGIFILQDSVIKYANSRTEEICGYTREELMFLPYTELIHPDDRELVKNNYFRRIQGETVPANYSVRTITKSGKTRLIHANATQVLWEEKPAVLYFARDITRLNELETKLQRAEKMEILGTMAGGVAHDLNNILSGLVSFPELMLMQLEDDSPLVEPINFMLDSGMKAADIVQDLLTLTRRGIKVEKIIDLNDIVSDYFNSAAHRRFQSGFPMIRFETLLDPDLLSLKGSPAHVTKVLMNLVINAGEAIEDNGVITIETFNQYIDAPLSNYDTIQEGDYVVLRVSDTGTGIPESFLNQIFEPFFTKKQMGRSGSGLGLSVVWNSVKDHQGYVEVRSKEDSGSTFEIYFPASRAEVGVASDFLDVDRYRGNGESVLVIDDIKEQRRIARDALYLLGYQPATVASGEKAIHFLRNYEADLLLLDMKMDPGMDGLDTYREILTINPSQKAVIASGFSESDRVKETIRLGAGQYIKKPYTIKNLAKALKRELEP